LLVFLTETTLSSLRLVRAFLATFLSNPKSTTSVLLLSFLNNNPKGYEPMYVRQCACPETAGLADSKRWTLESCEDKKCRCSAVFDKVCLPAVDGEVGDAIWRLGIVQARRRSRGSDFDDNCYRSLETLTTQHHTNTCSLEMSSIRRFCLSRESVALGARYNKICTNNRSSYI